MFARQSTRDIAVQAYNLVAQHIEECKETRKVMRESLVTLTDDLEKKHESNQKFQNKLLWGGVVVLATILYDIFKSGHFSF